MIKFILFISGLFFFITYSSGQSQGLASFIPADFSILDTASGDLNKDGNKDLLVILKNNLEETNGDTTRPLLILLGNEKDHIPFQAGMTA
ncbi:MAG: hypothetical protein ACHQFX_17285 [Chitinophagales bacterium]